MGGPVKSKFFVVGAKRLDSAKNFQKMTVPWPGCFDDESV